MEVAKALRSYRSLVRAAKATFKGDNVALEASRDRLRREFTKPVADQAEFLKRVQLAKDVAHILQCNVVQGVKNEKGNFKLGIRQSTEMGDNESRFQSNITSSAPSQGCCGGASRNSK